MYHKGSHIYWKKLQTFGCSPGEKGTEKRREEETEKNVSWKFVERREGKCGFVGGNLQKVQEKLARLGNIGVGIRRQHPSRRYVTVKKLPLRLYNSCMAKGKAAGLPVSRTRRINC